MTNGRPDRGVDNVRVVSLVIGFATITILAIVVFGLYRESARVAPQDTNSISQGFIE